MIAADLTTLIIRRIREKVTFRRERKLMQRGRGGVRSNPRFLLSMAVVFAFCGVLDGAQAYRSEDLVNGCLSMLWLVGAATWLVRYKMEKRWSEGR